MRNTGYYPRRTVCKFSKTGKCEFANYNMRKEVICEIASAQKKFNTSKKINNGILNMKRCPLEIK